MKKIILILSVLALMFLSACSTQTKYIDQDGLRFYSDGTIEDLNPVGDCEVDSDCNVGWSCCNSGAGPITLNPYTDEVVFLGTGSFCTNVPTCPFVTG